MFYIELQKIDVGRFKNVKL